MIQNKSKDKDKKGKKGKEKEPSLNGLEAGKNMFDKMSKRAKDSQVKVFSFSFNPLFIIIASIVGGLLLYGLLNFQKSDGSEITVREFVQNMKENKYSEVVIQDNGQAMAASKYIEVISYDEDQDDISSLEDLKDEETDVIRMEGSEGFNKVELSEFVKSLELPGLDKAFKSILNREGIDLVQEIIQGENFMIGKLVRKNGMDLLVQNIDKEDFEDEMAIQGKVIEELSVDFIELQSAAKKNKFSNFIKEFENGKYSDVWVLEEKIIAQIHEDKVTRHIVDTKSLNTDFPRFLQEEGVDFDEGNVEIHSESIPTIDFGLILQILSLLFIGFLVISILRGINGSGKSLMQFGKSKAKMFFGKKPEVTFKDVAGIDAAKEELNEIVMFLREPRKFLKLGARIPKGLIMVGPPGTGKTLLARAIAGEAQVPFFHTSGSEFEEMLVGAGASRVRDLFSKAKKAAPSLVFIDEIDAVARKRGTTIQSSSTEQTLNQILVEMDGFEKNTNVIVIAATNRPDVLDPAILRPGRFDRRIVIDLPDIKGREEILKIHSKNKPLAEGLDLNKVARRTVGYSGADLENMLNEAAILVAKEGRTEITFNDIEEAANRIVMGRERKLQRTDEEVKRTAYHEAGHAIIAKLTPESDPVHRITIVSRGMALGTTMQLPERDKYSQSYQEMESKLRVLMGGRAAEQLIYGSKKITSGAAKDIQEATKIARKMVKQFGFSEKLGLVKYGESNELQYLGYGYGDMRDFSDETARLIDEEVKRIIGEAYKDSMRILEENKAKLEKVADDLVENEVIEGEDFDKYFEN